MSTFALSLKNFLGGVSTFENLESQIERDIALGAVAADELLAELEAQNATLPLKEATYTGIRGAIVGAETRRRTQIGTNRATPENPKQTRVAGTNDQNTRDSAATEVFPSGQSSETTAPQDRPPRAGDTLNQRFVLEELIGSGGMSRVFRATDKRKLEARSREPHVAVKIMQVEGVDPGEAFIAMQREVQKSQALTHTNILRVNDFDRDGSIVYTTMELLTGQPLGQLITQAGSGGLPVDEAMPIIRQMSEALAYAHENNIVHADLKPSNVFITKKNVVKVIDFGIARAFHASDAPEEDRTVFDPRALGALTPAYASPEMLEDLSTDPRDDIYAIGCVAYELVAGRHPYSKLRATEARDNGHELRRPPGLSRAQWGAIEGALEFERDKRTPSVRAFLDQLGTSTGTGKSLLPILIGVTAAALLGGGALLWQSQTPVSVSVSVPTNVINTNALIQDCANCPAMLAVPAGTSQIGAAQTDRSGMFEYPRHDVTIADPFALSKYEVTLGDYRKFAQATDRPTEGGCRTPGSNWQPASARTWQSPGFRQTEQHPVTCVSWQDASDYVAWMSQTTAQRYRLPSEAEWEYAAREHAGSEPQLSSPISCAEANVADQSLLAELSGLSAAACTDGHAFTAPVDRNSTDAFADLRGNVFEWTADCWNQNYVGAPTDGSAWQRGNCSDRVLRGGSWFTAADELRLSYRNRYPVDYRSSTFGFRIVREINDAK